MEYPFHPSGSKLVKYGYPVLFKHFKPERKLSCQGRCKGKALATGALFMDDHRWPEAYDKVHMNGRTGEGTSCTFTGEQPMALPTLRSEEEFFKLPQITDWISMVQAGCLWRPGMGAVIPEVKTKVCGKGGSKGFGITARDALTWTSADEDDLGRNAY